MFVDKCFYFFPFLLSLQNLKLQCHRFSYLSICGENHTMEIIRGSLDDISRPASSEQTGSRVSSVSLPHSDRIYPTSPFSLVVLNNDAADIQVT